MTKPAPLVEAILTWALLAVLFVLSPLAGSIASVAAVVMMLGLVPFHVRDGRAVLKQPALLLLLAAFVVLALVFAITADEPHDFLYFANFLALPLAATVYLALPATARRADLLVVTLCLLGAVVAALVGGYDVFVRGLSRAEGFVGGANLLPRTAITLGFFALAGAFLVQGPVRFLFYLGPAAALIATYFSGSRGAALALPVLGLLAVVFLLIERQTRLHAVVMALLGGAALAAVLLAGNLGGLDRFSGIVGTVVELVVHGRSSDSATAERMVMLVTVWPAFLASPWIGWGWANMAAAATSIDPALTFAPGQNVFFHADIANFAVAGGTAGLAAWIAILVAPVAGALAPPRDTMLRTRLYLGLSLTLAYAVFGLTDFTLGYDLPTTLYAVLVAATVGAFRAPTARAD